MAKTTKPKTKPAPKPTAKKPAPKKKPPAPAPPPEPTPTTVDQARLAADMAKADQWEKDEDTLAELGRLHDLLRDRVRTVALRYQTAAYLVGRAGVGKTYHVEQTLNSLPGVSWHYFNARMSPAGLFDIIEQYTDSVIVVDDVPLLFGNKQGIQLLLAMCGGKPGQPRRVTWNVKGERRTTVFTGGLIAISNEVLTRKDPIGEALASRGAALHFDPTDQMIQAQIRALVRQGYGGVPSQECWEVAQFLVQESQASDFRLDLRYYVKAVSDYKYAKEKKAVSDWRDIVRSSLRSLALLGQDQEGGRAKRTAEMKKVVRELEARTDLSAGQRVDEFRRRTGGSQAAYYRFRDH